MKATEGAGDTMTEQEHTEQTEATRKVVALLKPHFDGSGPMTTAALFTFVDIIIAGGGTMGHVLEATANAYMRRRGYWDARLSRPVDTVFQ